MSKPAKKSHRKLFTVGSDAPFQFTEAYKSLRTNQIGRASCRERVCLFV